MWLFLFVRGGNNKMKFEGVLFIINKPSTIFPTGARGHKVILTKEAIQQGITQLPGKPLFSSECLKTHNSDRKVGVIEKAFIVGDMFCISGGISEDYSASLQILASEEILGLSYDLSSAHIYDKFADIFEVTSVTFLGATVLLQSKAAHREDCLFWVV
jgi:hypothetical protein